MSELVIAERSDIVAIANAVRNKTETTNEMTLGEIVTGINSIEAGVKLPELTNPASEAEIFNGYETIDETGSKITGTFSIDSELTTQDDLITQIQSALEGKAAGSGSSGETEYIYFYAMFQRDIYSEEFEKNRYVVKKGMTWEEFCQSSLDVDKEFIYGGFDEGAGHGLFFYEGGEGYQMFVCETEYGGNLSNAIIEANQIVYIIEV